MAYETAPPAKPRGRPRATEPGSCVSTWVRQSDHDALIRLAKKYDLTVSQVVARLLARTLR